jgi:hypothetical protein
MNEKLIQSYNGAFDSFRAHLRVLFYAVAFVMLILTLIG